MLAAAPDLARHCLLTSTQEQASHVPDVAPVVCNSGDNDGDGDNNRSWALVMKLLQLWGPPFGVVFFSSSSSHRQCVRLLLLIFSCNLVAFRFVMIS